MTRSLISAFVFRCLDSIIEGVLAIPNGLAIQNTPPFMIDTANMAFFQL